MKNKITHWIILLTLIAFTSSAQPTITISTPDSSICVNHIPTFTATINGCSNTYYILWMDGAFVQDTCYQPCTTWTTSFISGTHAIYAQLFCNLQGNPYSNQINMVVDPCVGVEEISNESLTSVYPNPSTGNITINVNSRWSSGHQLSVFDSKGNRMLLNYELKNNSAVFSTREFQDGIYFYHITDNNGNNSGTGKFVIEK